MTWLRRICSFSTNSNYNIPNFCEADASARDKGPTHTGHSTAGRSPSPEGRQGLPQIQIPPTVSSSQGFQYSQLRVPLLLLLPTAFSRRSAAFRASNNDRNSFFPFLLHRRPADGAAGARVRLEWKQMEIPQVGYCGSETEMVLVCSVASYKQQEVSRPLPGLNLDERVSTALK